MEKGNTALLLGAVLEGMKEAGASVELFYAKRLNVKPCLGELHCWEEKPGECITQDSMQSVYPKLRAADVLVLATPVYIPLPGEMQNFVNRLCPLLDPFLEFRDGRTRVRLREDVKIRKIVLVATCGWWEMGNFGTVLRIAEELAKDAGQELAAAVLRPHAYLMEENKQKATIVLEAAKQAGIQLIKEGRINKKLLDTISQPLISEEAYRQRDNDAYRKVRSEAGS
jgi:multimeric flavodoxin WrbA